MKHIFRYFISSLVLLVPVLAHAQKSQVADPPLYEGYKTGNGVATQKRVSEPSNGKYTLTLETFATGKTSVVKVTSPADIVLVLDLSQSMTQEYKTLPYTYTALQSASYSYQSYTTTYYYLHEGEYYAVSRNYYTTGNGQNNQVRHYYLTFRANNTDYYLYGDSVTTDRPSEPSGRRQNNQWQNTGETIWTGVLYTRSGGGTQSRLEALQEAVDHFVGVIYHNDNFDDDDNPRENPLGNRISVVTFGGPRTGTNATAKRSDLTDVTAANGDKNTSMISYIMGLTNSSIGGQSNMGTYSDMGMALANDVLAAIPAARKGQSTRTVVLFTDGAPGTGPGWTNSSIGVADDCIKAAATAKTTHTASVFTIILGNVENDDMGNYLQYTSSNYPNATEYDNPGTKKSDTYALDANEDITGIFETVAQASGGSESTIPAGTQVVDAVSNSFEVPSTFHASDVVVYTRNAKTDGTGFEENTNPLTKVILPDNYDLTAAPDPNASYMTNENTVGVYLKDGKLMIIGFNYSKLDTVDEETGEITEYGNWVGWRGDGVNCRGKELVIEFEIEAKDGVTGGDGTNTNAPNSGVYVPVYVDGVFQGYAPVNAYPYPQTDLPINLVIQKKGLRRGESATIQIYYAPVNKNEYDPNTGKPVPDLTNGWQNFSKVILTNTTDTDGATITKTLLCLDPEFVYQLEEDNWGWGYKLDKKKTDTSKQESNPFIFENTLNPDAVKHAEAVSINIFGEGGGSKTYKASKVLSY